MSVCGRESETEERGLASDGIQMATDTMHNNDLKVHSEYNFWRIGHFSILLVAISKLRMNTNTQNAVCTPCKSLLKSFVDKNSLFSHSQKRNSLIIHIERES